MFLPVLRILTPLRYERYKCYHHQPPCPAMWSLLVLNQGGPLLLFQYLRRDEPSAQPSPVPVDVPAPAPGLLPRREESISVQPKPKPSPLRASQPATVSARLTTTHSRHNHSCPQQVPTFNELGTSISKSVNTIVSYVSSNMLYHLGMDTEHFISSCLCCKAKVNTDPDILMFAQAMQDPQHHDEWRQSALAEIHQLESKGT